MSLVSESQYIRIQAVSFYMYSHLNIIVFVGNIHYTILDIADCKFLFKHR